jgi:hypothetical protein
VCPWRLNEDGKLGPDLFNRLSPDELDPVLRTELIELLQIYQRRWVVTGPCLDGGWYAAPRHDQTAPARARVLPGRPQAQPARPRTPRMNSSPDRPRGHYAPAARQLAWMMSCAGSGSPTLVPESPRRMNSRPGGHMATCWSPVAVS